MVSAQDFKVRAGRLGRTLLAGVALVLTANACQSTSSATPNTIELSNIRLSNVVPKSTPRQLVAAFQRYCLASSHKNARAALRKSDYIRASGENATTENDTESYVVDDRKPAVILTRAGVNRGCAVVAQARTGQTNRIIDFVKARLPTAVEIDPRRIGPRTERAWHDKRAGVLFLQRPLLANDRPSVLFGISWVPS